MRGRGFPPPRTQRDVAGQFLLFILFGVFFGTPGFLLLRDKQWIGALLVGVGIALIVRAYVVLKNGPQHAPPSAREPSPVRLLLAATGMFGFFAFILLQHLPLLAVIPVGGWLFVAGMLWRDSRRPS